MASLPLTPYPPSEIRKQIVPDEWALCMDAWLIIAQNFLLLPGEGFPKSARDPSLVDFLISYVENTASNDDAAIPNLKSASLRKRCFLIIHRILRETKSIPMRMLQFSFLADLALIYKRSQSVSSLLEDTWVEHKLSENLSMMKAKVSLSRLLEGLQQTPELDRQLLRAAALVKACYHYAQFLMIGSDLIDAISTAHDEQLLSAPLRKKLVALTYVCLTGLMRREDPKISILLDHLFSLQSTFLVKVLIGVTPFLENFQGQIAGKDQEAKRAKPLLETLAQYRRPVDGKPRKPIRRKIDKGKGKIHTGNGHNRSGQVHIHRLILISQIQDLFPDLGSAFIVKLLDEYGDDTEQVITHLLEENLPLYLRQADHKENLIDHDPTSNSRRDHDLVPDLAPHSTPPLLPSRGNIYDDDDFDRLAIDTSKVHLGRKNKDLTADNLLSAERPSTHKAAILSALAAFDSDDDERDDTYDAEDVGGTVDTTFSDADGDARVTGDQHEETLFMAYKTTPDVFKRDTETRRSKARMALQTETRMMDESIEGWALMLSRDPRRLHRLERAHDMAGGLQQRALVGTSWKGDSGTEGTEDSDVGIGGSGSRGGSIGRGRGRGWRGAGWVAGPADNRDTQVARQRKDANKGSRANHNRRDQRARKMARGGFAG